MVSPGQCDKWQSLLGGVPALESQGGGLVLVRGAVFQRPGPLGEARAYFLPVWIMLSGSVPSSVRLCAPTPQGNGMDQC